MVKVSIIIPCYKKAKYLAETFDSVLNQEFSDWECIIVNDGSPDDTEQIAKLYCGNDSRFKYIYQDNAGVSAARNNGIQASSGKYILPLDADDLISTDYLKEAVDYLEQHPECKLVYPLVKKFGITSGLYKIPEYSYYRLRWENLIVCSAVYKRADYDRTKGYDEHMRFGFEDWDFWLSFLREGDIVKRLNLVGLYYRQVEGSINHKVSQYRELVHTYLINNHLELYKPYFTSIIQFHEEARECREELARIKNTRFYKIREIFARPYRKIRYRNQ